METKSISIVAALAGISIIGSFSIILLNDVYIVSNNEERMNILENSFCQISSEDYLEYEDIKTNDGSIMVLSLFVEKNSTANLCFRYNSEHDNKDELKLEPEIYKSEDGILKPYTDTDITVNPVPDSIPLQKGFISIVAYRFNTFDDTNDGVYYMTIPQTCGLFPIVVYSGTFDDFNPIIKLQKGERHCGLITLNTKMIGAEGGILDYAKVEYVK